MHLIRTISSFICPMLAICLLSQELRAQDPHFSQFFTSPLTLNPALTGLFDGDFRVAGNFRNQWPTINNAFKTGTVSIDFSLLKDKIPENDRWSIGLLALNDRSVNRILNNNHYSLSTAYHKGLDENGYHQLTIGFQGTYTSKLLDVSAADFEDELTSLGFTGVTSDVFGNSRVAINYFDLQTGLLYSGTTNGDNSFYVGTSVYHVNRPNESFLGGSFILEPRVTFHGGGRLPLGTYRAFHGSVIHQRQGGATETVLGGAMSFNVNQDEYNPVDLYAGAWYRLKDAFIPYVGLEFGSFRVGYTYDVTMSNLRTANERRGGSEISLIWIRRPVEEWRRRLHCPKF